MSSNVLKQVTGVAAWAAIVLAMLALVYGQGQMAEFNGAGSGLMAALKKAPTNAQIGGGGSLLVSGREMELCAENPVPNEEDPHAVRKCRYRITGTGSINCKVCPLNLQIGDILCGERCEADNQCPPTFNIIADCQGGGRCGVIASFRGCTNCP